MSSTRTHDAAVPRAPTTATALALALAALAASAAAGAQTTGFGARYPAPLGVRLTTREYGAWADAVARLESDPSSQGRALHVLVVDNANGRPLPCEAYLFTLDGVSARSFTTGSCDRETAATMFVLTDRRGLYSDPDNAVNPLPATLGVRSRETAQPFEIRDPPPPDPLAPPPLATTVPGAAVPGGPANGSTPAPVALPPPGPWQTPTAVAPLEQRGCSSWDPRGCLSSPRTANGRHTSDAQRFRACKHGDVTACVQVAVSQLLAPAPATPDDAAAFEAFRAGCAAHVAAACTDLGWMFARGRGVVADLRSAVERFNEGCALGDASGCADAGQLYDAGVGGARDAIAAVEFYRRGCDASYGRACAYLGGMYARGDGVAQDPTGAVVLFGRACTATESSGCAALAEATRRGEGASRDPARAAQLAERGCTAGQADACLLLATMVERGEGVPADAARATQLRQRACDAGLQRACAAP